MMSKCTNCPNANGYAFCGMSGEARAFMESNSVYMEYPRGSVLFREGDRPNAIYVMCSGKVKVSVSSQEGRTMILRIAKAGDVLGLSGALDGAEQETTVEALEPVRARVLHLNHLTTMMQQYAEVSLGAAKSMARDYRAAFEEARLVALPSSPAGRIARLILDWAEEARRNSSPFVTMSLTHEEVASMAATTRETVTRTLSRLRKEKVISTRGVALTVLQPNALQRMSAC
ncbi:CRP/FNR family transcriptional regulator, anaerobic regulatory protein [Bryocella elongata]|uniref:CRP/FNR family transcriptional regulator, anaerobic regulatory protein n=1 Tax=Bryocella elongata TaxID=863522 RepID=A0A1H5VWL9_9BACT|nr:Crp/Fnr family transcriptional regulator [Bryocella elongata]SEF91689.1 CRP/FNR family transcriptional regulator, anaerobic regulatory protein [Bryocella elongata]